MPPRNLADLATNSRPEPHAILPLFIAVLDCVRQMHESGLQHVSLTPEAIRFAPDNQVFIRTQEAVKAGGTIYFSNSKYAAPEALRAGVDGQNCVQMDSYALGFMFYELLLGRDLFRKQFAKEETGPPSSWLRWHASEQASAPLLTELARDFPPAISNLIRGMIEKDPAKRTCDLGNVAAAFRNMVARTIVAPVTANPDGVFTAKNSKPAPLSTPSENLGQGVKAFVSSLLAGVPALLTWAKRLWSRYETEGQWALGVIAAVIFVYAGGLIIRDSPAQPSNDLPSMPKSIETDSGRMVLITGGGFTLRSHEAQGSEGNGAAYISPFYMDYREVTNEDLSRFYAATHRRCPTASINTDRGEPGQPALNVPWDIARAFAQWAGKYIPSQLEWTAATKDRGSPIIFSARRLLMPRGKSFEWIDSDLRSSAHDRNLVRRLVETDSDEAVSALILTDDLESASLVSFRCAVGPEILNSAHILKGRR